MFRRVARFLVSLRMEPTEEQLTALANYRDVINQHLPEIAEGIGVPSQTLKGWMEDKGEPTSEQAQKILDFLRDKVGGGRRFSRDGLVGVDVFRTLPGPFNTVDCGFRL